LVGVVNLEHDQVWLLRKREFESKAQQHGGGLISFSMLIRIMWLAKAVTNEILSPFRIERRMVELFGMTRHNPLDDGGAAA
jgi:hypothetical protein